MNDDSKLAIFVVSFPLIIAIFLIAMILPNGSQYVLWIFLLAVIIISGVFLCGKGAWAIAGFNTLDDAEKSKYDTKKLTRLVGVIFLTIIPLIVSAIIENESLSIFSIILIVCVSIFVIIYGNKHCFL